MKHWWNDFYIFIINKKKIDYRQSSCIKNIIHLLFMDNNESNHIKEFHTVEM